ncbi:MAG: hypothetical protein OXN92_15070, partial [Gammaproteobacteria bacterium]|nr:hypothetical protein [Gammaproteobacteria bacterium]
MNGFLGALAEVRRHRSGGGRRRVPDAAPTGVLDARFVVQQSWLPTPLVAGSIHLASGRPFFAKQPASQ